MGGSSLAVRVGGVEGALSPGRGRRVPRHADQLHVLDLDLLRVGLSFEQRRDLGRELFERHRELAVFLAGKQRGADRWPFELDDLDRRVFELLPSTRSACGDMAGLTSFGSAQSSDPFAESGIFLR
jgi:hypothetical protein